MRRFFTIFLVSLFSFLLIVPALAASFKTDLPACCRKDGKHHCTMQEAGHTSKFAVVAIRDKCPCFPQALVVSHHEITAGMQAAGIFAGWISHPSSLPQVEAAYRVSRQRSHQKRGPPSLS